MPTEKVLENVKARARLNAALREWFARAGYLEVETPALVPAAGMEPHIDPFEVPFVPQTGVGQRRTLYLHTSPEYAMKRLLAAGAGAIFQICKVFRNGEVAAAHNPEFTLLEFYRPRADYHAIMADLEQMLAHAEKAVRGAAGVFSQLPYERLSVRDAVKRETGIDLMEHSTAASLRSAAEHKGIRIGSGDSFDDVFFHLFLQAVEPKLGRGRPTFLTEYPASMASLARLKPGDPSVAERVELYVEGSELANGFSELTDAAEQRRRLLEEAQLRQQQNRVVPPLDEKFLDAVGRMPESSGIAVGLDRVLMLMVGAREIADVLPFPAKDFV
jgi:elongation factor P--(R)-beta-lysine ligase